MGLRPLVCFAKCWYYTTVSKHKYTPLNRKKQTGAPRLLNSSPLAPEIDRKSFRIDHTSPGFPSALGTMVCSAFQDMVPICVLYQASLE